MKWFLDNANTVRSMEQAREIYPATATWRTYLSGSMEITPLPPLVINMGIEITYGSDDESGREFAPRVSVY
jgi:outer membrane protein assembly factor BamA